MDSLGTGVALDLLIVAWQSLLSSRQDVAVTVFDLEGLTYEKDRRKDLTDGRRRNFKQGWTRAVEGQEYEGVLEELTWNNLGWRLGRMFGPTPDDLREEILDWCAEQRKAGEVSRK